MSEFAIEVKDLTKVFAGFRGKETRAVDGVTFQVRKGEIFGLLGPNGAGKTTIVRILTTILQPSSGQAFVMGREVSADPLGVRRQIGVVLQETAIETMLSVNDNLLIFGRMHHLSGQQLTKRVDEILHLFSLFDSRKEKAQDLSVGLRRRVQVAKAFLVETPVLFLDEATTGMDPMIKRQTLNSIREMADRGRTIFLTTQMLEEAEQLCNQIVILNQGKTIASGNLDRLRMLATRRFHISVTFADSRPEAFDALRKLNPLSIEINDRTSEMTFEGEETAILQSLAEVSSHWRIERFEVRGDSLEEIFMELIEK